MTDSAARGAHLVDVCETILAESRPAIRWVRCRVCRTEYPEGAGRPECPVSSDGVCGVCEFCGPPEQAR